MSKGLILSLCDDSGNWPDPWREAGYRVECVDIKRGRDVRLMYRPKEPVLGILAAPPCTVFASSGARWPRSDDDYREALAVVDACLRLVVVCQPKWWSLENPVGKLVRWLGPARCYVHPYEFSGWSGPEEHYTKRTGLWGNFNLPERNPGRGRPKPFFGWTQLGGKSERTKALRSVTPRGLAVGFYRANVESLRACA